MGYGKTYRTKWLEDLSGDQGTAGQILSTTSSGISWIDASTLPGAGLWVADGNDIYNSNSGNVGIGTTSPSAKLHVDGELLIASGEYLSWGTSGATAIEGSTVSNKLAFFIQGTERMRIASSGNVGIGTTSPGYKLQVDGGNVAITGGSSSTLFINENTNQLYGDENGVVILKANDNIRLHTNSSERIRVLNNGNVGIGASSPNASLQIGSAVSTSSEKLDVRGNSSANYVASFEQDHVTGYGVLIDTDGTLVGEPALKIQNTNSELFYVGSNGNVGIGTTNPSANLDIEDASGVTVDINSSSGDGLFRFQDNGTTKWSMGRDNTQQNFVFSNSSSLGSNNVLTLAHSTGNVGIGTTSPSEKLTVDGKIKVTATNNASIILQEIGQEEYEIRAAGSGLFFKNDGDNQFALDQTGDVMFYKTDGSVGLTYKGSSGNVGIGTDSPSAKLEITQTTAAEGLRVDGAGSGFALIVNGGTSYKTSLKNASVGNGYVGNTPPTNGLIVEGNVGIGTDSPSEKLDVGGKIRARSWFTGVDNTNTLYSSTSTGVYLQGSSFTGVGSVISFRRTDGSVKAVVNTETGNVGIGTTSPSEKLEVEGNIQAISTGGHAASYVDIVSGATWRLASNPVTGTNAYGLDIIKGSGGTDVKMSIDSSGNVGIGTSSPSHKLDVTGSARLIDSSPTLTLQDSDESNVFASIIQSSGSLFLRSRDGSSNGSIVFQKQNSSGITESMRIDDSGNVGIGTTSPTASALFEVASTTKGVLLPRMNTTQINAISSPAEGLTVYNTLLSTLCFFNGVSWQKVTSTAM